MKGECQFLHSNYDVCFYPKENVREFVLFMVEQVKASLLQTSTLSRVDSILLFDTLA